MRNIVEAVDNILKESKGYTTTYERKPNKDNKSKVFSTVMEMSEDELDLLEKQIASRRSRLQFLKEQKEEQDKQKKYNSF